ncbi:MAG: hypothetical protein IPI35_26595 [Deltaproteobacteria bacterium]|nr:hypothetical protein [Deltaproteobacteria bacterium]
MRRLALIITLLVPGLTACAPTHCEVDGVQHKVGDTTPAGMAATPAPAASTG